MSAALRHTDVGPITVFAAGFAPIGGVESFLYDLLTAMSQRGFDCRLLCWGGRDARLRQLSAGGVRVHRLPFRRGCRWAWPDRLLLSRTRSVILDSGLVLFAKPLPEPVQRGLLKLRGTNPGPRFVLVTPYRPAEMWQSAPPLLNRLDAIAVQAEGFRTDLQALGYAGPITVLPYIPPACTAVAPLPRDPLSIGYLGRLVADKNLPYLLHAFRALLRRRPAVLNLYGDGPLGRPLRRLARALGLESTVRFHGPVAPDRVPAAIDSCSLFAFTSVTEGQCLAALEILARGRRIVATPAGALPEMLADPRLGSIAPGDSPESFAQSLLAAGRRSPEQVQEAYRSRFDRDATIDAYAGWFRQSWRSVALTS